MICGVVCSDRRWADCVLGGAVGPRLVVCRGPGFLPSLPTHSLPGLFFPWKRRWGADGAQAQAGVPTAVTPVGGQPPQGEPVSTNSRDPGTQRHQHL